MWLRWAGGGGDDESFFGDAQALAEGLPGKCSAIEAGRKRVVVRWLYTTPRCLGTAIAERQR
jgi:hypothetical protein